MELLPWWFLTRDTVDEQIGHYGDLRFSQDAKNLLYYMFYNIASLFTEEEAGNPYMFLNKLKDLHLLSENFKLPRPEDAGAHDLHRYLYFILNNILDGLSRLKMRYNNKVITAGYINGIINDAVHGIAPPNRRKLISRFAPLAQFIPLLQEYEETI